MNIKNLKILSCLLLFLVSGCSFCGQQKINTDQDLCSTIFSAEKKPTQALKLLLSHFNINHNETLCDIVEKTQKSWLRPANVERFNLTEVYAGKMGELKPLFIQLGLVNEIIPQRKFYDYAFVFGASMSTARVRISWLTKLWNDGVRFGKIFVLTGQRSLDSVQETLDMLKKEYVERLRAQDPNIMAVRSDWVFDPSIKFESETDMMRIIYEQSDMPKDLRGVEVVFIDSPMQETADGKKRRPNTAATLKSWLKTKPENGTILAISNQPFVIYQYSISKIILPERFNIEVVGPAVPENYDSVSVILDSLARVLYQEQIRLKNNACVS